VRDKGETNAGANILYRMQKDGRRQIGGEYIWGVANHIKKLNMDADKW
jgi:hypothetical protein